MKAPLKLKSYESVQKSFPFCTLCCCI
ncbi:hypothetical protein A5797_001325, partial [Enterococcus faecalis]